MLRPAGRARDPPANFPHTFLTEHTGEALSARGFPLRPACNAGGAICAEHRTGSPFYRQEGRPMGGLPASNFAGVCRPQSGLHTPAKKGPPRKAVACARDLPPAAYPRAVCRTVHKRTEQPGHRDCKYPFDVFEQMRTHAPGPLSDLYGLRRLWDGVMQPRHMRHGAALLFPQPKAALRQRRIQT